MNEADILAFVLSSGILNEYVSKDGALRRLIDTASQSSEHGRSHEDISVSGQTVPATVIGRTYRLRLTHIPDERQFTGEERTQIAQLKIATQQLVDYCAERPDAGITGVIFNCSEHSFAVFCGIMNERLDAICVIAGKHIPSYAMKRPQL